MAVGDHKFSVEVLTPEGEVFNGEVIQLSTRTMVGEVGILANHAPLLASLKPAELRLRISDSETVRFAQSHGMLQVYGNHAQVLIEQAIPPENLDQATLEAELDDAMQRLSEAADDSAEERRAEKDRDRAETFLKIAQGN